jgi:hypothetical protein
LANFLGTTQLCSDFIAEAQQHDNELLQTMNQSTDSSDSYWHRTHDIADKFVRDGKGPRYAVDVEA